LFFIQGSRSQPLHPRLSPPFAPTPIALLPTFFPLFPFFGRLSLTSETFYFPLEPQSPLFASMCPTFSFLIFLWPSAYFLESYPCTRAPLLEECLRLGEVPAPLAAIFFRVLSSKPSVNLAVLLFVNPGACLRSTF